MEAPWTPSLYRYNRLPIKPPGSTNHEHGKAGKSFNSRHHLSHRSLLVENLALPQQLSPHEPSTAVFLDDERLLTRAVHPEWPKNGYFGVTQGTTCRLWRRYMRKSWSVVRMTGSAKTSVIRTRQASARLIGMLEYFSISFVTGARWSMNWKPITRALRRSIAPTAGAPFCPRRWYASERTASQVDQGGGKSDARRAAHWWQESRLLSKATTKPASTRTFLAITGASQMGLLARSQIAW